MICIENLSGGYNGNIVFSDVSLEIEEGDRCGILGSSGCGKSTLLRIVAGFLPVARGSISIDGRDVNDVAPSKRNIAYQPQKHSILPGLTAFGNIAMAVPPGIDRKNTVEKAAAMAGVTHLLGEMRDFSGGEATRIAMARVIASNARYVLLDEPFTGLDAVLRIQLRKEMLNTVQEINATTIIVTHDVADLIGLQANFVGVFEKGRLAQFGTFEQVLKNPASTHIARLLQVKRIAP